MATEIGEFAAAKVNLALHVTGQRADGYHLLDSLVVFAEVGDRVTVREAEQFSLRIIGPFAAVLSDTSDNLVLRAARMMGVPVAVTLEKNLPVASGIGGGSSDAAATLRAVAQLTGRPLPEGGQVLALGADVPVCLANRAARLSGVGGVLHPVTGLPACWLVLVNPGVAVSTPQVFGPLANRNLPPMPDALPAFSTAKDLAVFLAGQRNDLEPSALALAPEIAKAKAVLAGQPDCLFARMSGSGATVFGLFATQHGAEAAANALQNFKPEWWVAAAAMRQA